MLVEGATTTEVFESYITQVLIPWLRPGQIVILDNLAAHTGSTVQAQIEAAGGQLRFLPTLRTSRRSSGPSASSRRHCAPRWHALVMGWSRPSPLAWTPSRPTMRMAGSTAVAMSH